MLHVYRRLAEQQHRYGEYIGKVHKDYAPEGVSYFIERRKIVEDGRFLVIEVSDQHEPSVWEYEVTMASSPKFAIRGTNEDQLEIVNM